MGINLQERTVLILKEQGIKQRDLVLLTGATKGLVGQWVNGPAKTMSYKHAKPIAAKYGYSIDWLMAGTGAKKANGAAHQVAEAAASYGELRPEALELAQLWSELAPEVAGWIRDLIFITHSGEKRRPWLRRGRPQGETYPEWERRMEQNFALLTAHKAGKLKQPPK